MKRPVLCAFNRGHLGINVEGRFLMFVDVILFGGSAELEF
jgi:hypothetical protein